MDLESILMIALPVLLVALLIFEKRRRRHAVARQRHFEKLLEDERFEELDEELDSDAEAEALADEESIGESVAAFVKGRPTRRLSASGIIGIVHGIVGIGLMGFVLFMVFTSAVHDPVVRIVIAATVGAMGTVLLLASIVRRNRREKELLEKRR